MNCKFLKSVGWMAHYSTHTVGESILEFGESWLKHSNDNETNDKSGDEVNEYSRHKNASTVCASNSFVA